MTKGKIILKNGNTYTFEQVGDRVNITGSHDATFESRKEFLEFIYLQNLAEFKKFSLSTGSKAMKVPGKQWIFRPATTKPVRQKPKATAAIHGDENERLKAKVAELEAEIEALKESQTEKPVAIVGDPLIDKLLKLKSPSSFTMSLVNFFRTRGYLTERQKYFAECEIRKAA